MEDKGARLRRDVESDDITVLPGAYDALTAKLAEHEGFDCVFTSGFSISASRYGLPDLGFLDLTGNVEHVRHVTKAVDVPLVADADTGYGNAVNVRRSVGELMDAGVAGVILEDQKWPKRCGHMSEKKVVSVEEHASRIQAAADERDSRENDLVVVARTDAREPHGLEEAINRGRRYEEAGADVVFVEAPEDMEELEQIASAFDAPSFANMIEGGKTPYLSSEEVEELGFDIVVYPLAATLAATHGAREAYRAVAQEGEASDVDTVGFDEFDGFIEADRYRRMAEDYGR